MMLALILVSFLMWAPASASWPQLNKQKEQRPATAQLRERLEKQREKQRIRYEQRKKKDIIIIDRRTGRQFRLRVR